MRQKVMQTLGISLVEVDPGAVELQFPFHAKLTQQHGFIHAGIISTALDSACGYAAFSLMPEDASVLTVEFKVDLLSPAKGDYFTVSGRVVKSGKTISVAQGQAWAHNESANSERGDQRKLVAQMTATLMAVFNRDEIRESAHQG